MRLLKSDNYSYYINLNIEITNYFNFKCTHRFVVEMENVKKIHKFALNVIYSRELHIQIFYQNKYAYNLDKKVRKNVLKFCIKMQELLRSLERAQDQLQVIREQ